MFILSGIRVKLVDVQAFQIAGIAVVGGSALWWVGSLALSTNPVTGWLGVVGLLASPLTAAVGGHILEGGHVGF